MLPGVRDGCVVPKLVKVPKEPMWGFILFVCLLKEVDASLGEHLKYFKCLKKLVCVK